jgi:putative methyltransferase (TIGR04325 family)
MTSAMEMRNVVLPRRKRADFLARQLVPPLLATPLRRLAGRDAIRFRLGFDSWSAADAAASGYDDEQIEARVLAATEAVLRGDRAFERDGVTFDSVQYSWPMTSGLLMAVASVAHPNVMDVGGALGGTYLSHRALMPPSLTWSVVEQQRFVDLGKARICVPGLRFHHSVTECAAEAPPNVALLSSVLQYLPDPFAMLNDIIALPSIQWIVIDRTSCVDHGRSVAAVQVVRPPLYSASYPVWFLEERQILETIVGKFELVAAFDSFEQWHVRGRRFQDRGWIFRRLADETSAGT